MLCAELQTKVGEVDIDVLLEVPAGRCLALVGPSGAGKTTILRAIAGTLRPRRGRVSCGEQLWVDTEQGIWLAPERRRAGFLFQEGALFPHLCAWRNVGYALHELPRAERKQQALALLERFGVAHLAGARPDALSGGERQRVALARALARKPSALLLDEPLSGLDARSRADAMQALAGAIEQSSAPTVLVTHDFHEAAQMADEVAVIEHGKVVQRGTPLQLLGAPASPFVAAFAQAHPLGMRAAADELPLAAQAQPPM